MNGSNYISGVTKKMRILEKGMSALDVHQAESCKMFLHEQYNLESTTIASTQLKYRSTDGWLTY